jgi:monofunctional biosynthetic peptidoglycan transglycosylase
MRFACSLFPAGQTRAWLRDTAHPVRIAARFLRALAVFVVGLHAALIVLVFLGSLVLLKLNPPFTALMVWRGVTVHQKARPIRFVPLRQIPRVARSMVVRLEDYRFYSHHGVDLGALREAWTINTAIGRTAVGGSTIPMQLARNLFLTPRKTYLRKYLEAVIALEMSVIVPKDRLLELYLNYIEWGKGIYGIGAASAYYYKTGVGGLGLDEMRRLATIITNPLRYDVQTFTRSAQMSQRYAYLVSRFPDPAAEPIGLEGAVAPIPDAPAPAAPARGVPAPPPAATARAPTAAP